jgi:hypothetical protein
MITENERDIISILKTITDKMALTDREAAAMNRLLDQMPKPVVDVRPDSERRADYIAKMKGSPNPVNRGMVLADPGPTPTDGETRKDFIERRKRPTFERQVT